MTTQQKYWVVVGVMVALFFVFQKRIRKYTGIVWDPYTEKRIWSLHPAIRADVRTFINKAEHDLGIFLRITSGMRTDEEQMKLYLQGRETPGSIVTNALPGQSLHNYGLAIDVVEIKKGDGLWVNPKWEQIGALGKSLGFQWGGDWNTVDHPHFYKKFGYSTSQLAVLKKQSNTEFINLT